MPSPRYVTSLLSAAMLLALLPAALATPTLKPSRESERRADQLIMKALSLDGRRDKGASIFNKQCASCHGKDAQGDAAKRIPALAGQRQAYLVEQLADFFVANRPSTQMHEVVSQSSLSSPQEWMNVATYLSRMPIMHIGQTGSGTEIPLGQGIFRQQCVSCHATNARGDKEGFVPSLRNQHYSYLLQELASFSRDHRGNVDKDLQQYMQGLSEYEMAAVADYLSRFSGPVQESRKLPDSGEAGD